MSTMPINPELDLNLFTDPTDSDTLEKNRDRDTSKRVRSRGGIDRGGCRIVSEWYSHQPKI